MTTTRAAHMREDEDIVLRVENLRVEYVTGRGERVHAVSDISFDARRGETVGLVGESGCGKSSAAKAVMQLPPPSGGSVAIDNVEMTTLRGAALRRQRHKVQMIFQDPISSLNPLRKVQDIIGEGLRIRGGMKESEIQ